MQLSRKKPDPSHSLGQFLLGIYDYYHDRGMPQQTAKARMIDVSLEEIVKLMKQEKEVPDHMLVLMAQWMSRALNQRGNQMTKEVKAMQERSTEDIIDVDLTPFHEIKQTKDALDKFIETYVGWSETNGKERQSRK